MDRLTDSRRTASPRAAELVVDPLETVEVEESEPQRTPVASALAASIVLLLRMQRFSRPVSASVLLSFSFTSNREARAI
jgi:hypothetical protein